MRLQFCCDFTSLSNLCDAFIAYCPNTFSYDGVVGIGEDDNIVEIIPDDGVMTDTLATKMRYFVNDLLGETNSTVDTVIDSGDSTNDKSVTDNEAINTTGGTLSSQGDIKNAKIVLGVENLLACVDVSNLSKLALDSSSFLDTKDQGSISSERKVKSLRSRWFCSSGSKSNSNTNSSKEGIWIE